MNSIFEKIFPYNLLGKTYTSKPEDIEDRSAMFRERWDSWKHTSIKLPADLHKAASYGSARYIQGSADKKVKTFAKKHKLKEFWEYQVRGDELRFADEDFALLFRLTL